MPIVPESLGRLGTYGGTFGIDWSMPFVPWQSLRTFGIDQSMPLVPQSMPNVPQSMPFVPSLKEFLGDIWH